MTKFAVLLSGCGYLDGSEIQESVATLLAIDRLGIEWEAFAPDAPQADVVDHKSRAAGSSQRNILSESARIARGNVKPSTALDPKKIDALVIPGGFGAAKNLCNFASAGADCSARPELVAAIRETHRLGKPIGAICIAPALVAAAFRGTDVHPTLTIGNDAGTAKALEAMGARHKNCDVRDCVVDDGNKIVSTPAYMLARRVSEAADGIDRLVSEVARLAGAARR
jgi:enhancing lycopene biosynthesis protein 2